jgi:hypothetical protein
MNVVAPGNQAFGEVQDVTPGASQGGFQNQQDFHCIPTAEVP